VTNCPFAVVGFDFVELDGTVGYFMDKFTRGDLLDFVIATNLCENEIARMAYQILRALAYLHSIGVAHRDVKLENILLTGEDPIPDAYLGDFGFAATRNAEEGEFFLDSVGSKPYCAPELLRNMPYTEAVDMWAFGVVLFVMFVRQMPFPDAELYHDEWMYQVVTGEWYEDLLSDSGASEAAYHLISACLRVDPAERPTPAEALEHEFFAMLDAGEDIKAEIGALDQPFDEEDPFLN
jgi:serine/threonine protein kinase